MRFLVPLFDCYSISNNVYKLNKNVAYGFDSYPILISNKEGKVFLVSQEANNNICVKYLQDEYIFLFKDDGVISSVVEIKYLNQSVFISYGEKLVVSINSKVVIDDNVKVCYSHYEVVDNLCLIYFNGDRNYIIILDRDNVKFKTYYDEFNKIKKEIYILTRCYDCLNHGKVIHINNGVIEEFLVYLDVFLCV